MKQILLSPTYTVRECKQNLSQHTIDSFDMKQINIFDVLEKYPSFSEETRYCIGRISSSNYLPINMITNIALHKAMSRLKMVNMDWWLELKQSLESIVAFRRWCIINECPFQ